MPVEELRNFPRTRQRVRSLQRIVDDNQRVIDVTDWRTKNGVDHDAELRAIEAQIAAAGSEIEEQEFLLAHYQRTMLQRSMLLITPHTITLTAAIVLSLFIVLFLLSAYGAGIFHGS